MSRAPKPNNSGKKEDTIEKIKEIKRRQHNWLKQRDEQLERSKSLVVVQKSDTKISKKFEKSRIAGSANNRYSTQEKSIPNSRNSYQDQDSNDMKLKPKGKFKSWLQERGDNSDKTSEKNQNDRNDRRLNGQLQNETTSPSTSEVNILRVDSARSAQYATPDPGYHGYELHGDVEEHSRILSPDQFDFLADKIIAKVKNDLNIKEQPVNKNTHNDRGHSGQIVKQSRPQNNDIITKDLESHYCKVCRSLMTSSGHTPMLLIPCGHTVCAACAKERELCVHCGCEINSVTCNIMLQQIIQDFQQRRKPLSDATRGQHGREYSASMYSDKNKDTDYASSMKTLQTRHVILSEELQMIHSGLSITASNIEKEKRHIENISKEEEKIRNEMLRLEEKLKSLHEHKSDFTDNCKALESKHLEETNKKCLLQDSLCSLEQEMEKVKLLAEEMQSYTYS